MLDYRWLFIHWIFNSRVITITLKSLYVVDAVVRWFLQKFSYFFSSSKWHFILFKELTFRSKFFTVKCYLKVRTVEVPSFPLFQFRKSLFGCAVFFRPFFFLSFVFCTRDPFDVFHSGNTRYGRAIREQFQTSIDNGRRMGKHKDTRVHVHT